MIKQLNEEKINLISSGEVLNDAKSIVKEILENSIDAESTKIIIKLETDKTNQFINNIIIKDNGVGIDKYDLLKLGKRYSTSKFLNDDIKNIKSLGFRGEGLSLISYICFLKIESKKESNKCGYFNNYYKGTCLETNLNPLMMENGTNIICKDIFNNCKVKQNKVNFIKNLKKIQDMVFKYSINFVNIQFTLNVNNTVQYDSKLKFKDISKKDIILNYYKSSISKNLLIINEYLKNDNINIEIITTQINDFKKKKIVSFFNDRLCKNKLLKQFIEKAFLEATYSINNILKSYFFYINIKINNEDNLDFNIKPNKSLVKIKDEKLIFNYINVFLTKNLRDQNNVKFYKTKLSSRSNSPNSNLNYKRPDFSRNDPKSLTIEQVIKLKKIKNKINSVEIENAMPNILYNCSFVGCKSIKSVLLQESDKLLEFDFTDIYIKFIKYINFEENFCKNIKLNMIYNNNFDNFNKYFNELLEPGTTIECIRTENLVLSTDDIFNNLLDNINIVYYYFLNLKHPNDKNYMFLKFLFDYYTNDELFWDNKDYIDELYNYILILIKTKKWIVDEPEYKELINLKNTYHIFDRC